MQEACTILGQGRIYVTFDSVNPSFPPGTGTSKIGGFLTRETQKMICSLTGLNLFGTDLVEVSPPFDPSVEQPESTRL
jgi:arginase family enzyme|tara:strand:- start:383 stop:616 length:234 start_codon:yes stop_codon:yes gene_type:complete